MCYSAVKNNLTFFGKYVKEFGRLVVLMVHLSTFLLVFDLK